MNRDLVINILLIIAGIVLAIVLFGAGAVWRGRTSARPPGVSLDFRDERLGGVQQS